MDVLEIIRQAMANTPPNMVGFSYQKKDSSVEEYIVEPYEINESEGLFWGYKINDKRPGIRKFFIYNLINVQQLAEVFSPRWELFPYGK